MKYNPTLHKLSNGVTVILDPMDIETVAIKVLFATGNRDELPHEYGITHFCEHMLCKGTSKLPNKRAIDDYMDYYGASRNAVTGNAYMALIGRVLAENVNILIATMLTPFSTICIAASDSFLTTAASITSFFGAVATGMTLSTTLVTK